MDRSISLRGSLVLLEPLQPEHLDELWPEAGEPRIWQCVAATVEDRSELEAWIAARLRPADQGRALAFLQREARTGRAVGATNLYDIDREHGTCEVGHTWLTPRVWGTPINLESKRLLLGHAFDDLAAVRVQIKADVRNRRSQRAIEKLGAVREGVLRNVQRLPDGTPRDMVIYSVTDTDWPLVRDRLDVRLAQRLAEVAVPVTTMAEPPAPSLVPAVSGQGSMPTPAEASFATTVERAWNDRF